MRKEPDYEPDAVYPELMLRQTVALTLYVSLCGWALTDSVSKAPLVPTPPLVEELVEEEEPTPFHEQVSILADLISQGEGDWNAVNRGYAGDTPGGIVRLTGKTFEDFTVGQVMDMQRGWLYAVGRYQFVPRTLRFAVKHSSVNRLDMFTPDTQNKLFASLLLHKRPTIGGYLLGHHNSLNAALKALAREWASVEYYGWGRSYYAVGGNRAHITWREAADALNETREVVLNS